MNGMDFPSEPVLCNWAGRQSITANTEQGYQIPTNPKDDTEGRKGGRSHGKGGQSFICTFYLNNVTKHSVNRVLR